MRVSSARDLAVCDLGDVEPRRVGPDVDYRDPHGQSKSCAGTW